ncbi:MAG TPA: hypothetical protein VK558_11740 [Patescibacteria group bacterium]|nr:hypothetical protein [Patescibacteria group bacterium]
MSTANTTTPTRHDFAAVDGPPPADMQLTWTEVRALGLTEAPADIGPSDYQLYRAAQKETLR